MPQGKKQGPRERAEDAGPQQRAPAARIMSEQIGAVGFQRSLVLVPFRGRRHLSHLFLLPGGGADGQDHRARKMDAGKFCRRGTRSLAQWTKSLRLCAKLLPTAIFGFKSWNAPWPKLARSDVPMGFWRRISGRGSTSIRFQSRSGSGSTRGSITTNLRQQAKASRRRRLRRSWTCQFKIELVRTTKRVPMWRAPFSRTA